MSLHERVLSKLVRGDRLIRNSISYFFIFKSIFNNYKQLLKTLCKLLAQESSDLFKGHYLKKTNINNSTCFLNLLNLHHASYLDKPIQPFYSKFFDVSDWVLENVNFVDDNNDINHEASNVSQIDDLDEDENHRLEPKDSFTNIYSNHSEEYFLIIPTSHNTIGIVSSPDSLSTNSTFHEIQLDSENNFDASQISDELLDEYNYITAFYNECFDILILNCDDDDESVTDNGVDESDSILDKSIEESKEFKDSEAPKETELLKQQSEDNQFEVFGNIDGDVFLKHHNTYITTEVFSVSGANDCALLIKSNNNLTNACENRELQKLSETTKYNYIVLRIINRNNISTEVRSNANLYYYAENWRHGDKPDYLSLNVINSIIKQ